ncbi:hypothetical protein HPB47_021189 [Ixodes persulcatus]|uniref:Uncharacterized protein n=1 Tax=Ixodes persulcatus TaxID=34615 RepID=A0AC60QDL0_IXOPE|nr:hypothetical protein HPB47_021189 [Ixodes persulcatus]
MRNGVWARNTASRVNKPLECHVVGVCWGAVVVWALSAAVLRMPSAVLSEQRQLVPDCTFNFIDCVNG